MSSDFNASVDGRAVTVEYDMRKHAAKPVSPNAVRRATQRIYAVSKLCALRVWHSALLRRPR